MPTFFSLSHEWLQISAATKHRSVGATNLNRASSRSHAILTIEASIVDPVANISTFICFSGFYLLNSISALTGKINLVDLAGSENNKVSERQPVYGKNVYGKNGTNLTLSLLVTILLVWPNLQPSTNP